MVLLGVHWLGFPDVPHPINILIVHFSPGSRLVDMKRDAAI
jgi:hypothetical protein